MCCIRPLELERHLISGMRLIEFTLAMVVISAALFGDRWVALMRFSTRARNVMRWTTRETRRPLGCRSFHKAGGYTLPLGLRQADRQPDSC